MNMINDRRLRIFFIILAGMLLFATALFWEGSRNPTWAAQSPDPGTGPNPGPTTIPDNDNDNNQGDDDDDGNGRPGGSPPGRPPGGGPPGGGPPGNGPRGPNLADLSLSKTVNDPLPHRGQVITYTIVISNSGPRAAFGVRVLDQLPVGVVLSNAVSTRGRYNSRTGLWDIGFVRVTEQITLNLISVVTATSQITNTVELMRASPADPDSVPANGEPDEDDRNYAVITPTLAFVDQAENGGEAAFMDQAPPAEAAQAEVENDVSQPEDNPSAGIEAPHSVNGEASVTAVANPTEGFPLTWILLLGGGVGLIAAGLWLAKQ